MLAGTLGVVDVEFLDFMSDLSKLLVEVFGLLERSLVLYHFIGVCLVEEGGVVELQAIDSFNLCLIEPFNSLPIFPKTIFDFVFLRHSVSPEAMLLALIPVPFVASPICPGIDTEPMLLVKLVFALVNSTVFPDVNPHPVHVIV